MPQADDQRGAVSSGGPGYLEAKRAYSNTHKKWKKDQSSVAKRQAWIDAKEIQRIAYKNDLAARNAHIAENSRRREAKLERNRDKVLAKERVQKRAYVERVIERIGVIGWKDAKRSYNQSWRKRKQTGLEKEASETGK